jgi:hypothetical protein
MPTVTHDLISSHTTSGSTSTVTFSSIPQTYTDLRIIASVRATHAEMFFRLNNNSSANYSRIYMYGTTASIDSGRQNDTTGCAISIGDTDNNALENAGIEIYIFDYTSSTKLKTFSSSNGVDNDANTGIRVTQSNLFRSQTAVSQVEFVNTTSNFATGCVFNLYGIKAGS